MNQSFLWVNSHKKFLVMGQDRDEKTGKEGKEQDKKEKDMIIFQEMITIPNQEEIDELVEGNMH